LKVFLTDKRKAKIKRQRTKVQNREATIPAPRSHYREGDGVKRKMQKGYRLEAEGEEKSQKSKSKGQKSKI